MKEHYSAIALKKYDIGEVDRIYVFYTRERGLIRVKAKGVRRAHARLAPHVEDFVVAQIGVVRGRGRDTLTGAYVDRSHGQTRSDLESLLALGAMRDQLLRVIHDEQVDPQLYDLWVALMTLIEQDVIEGRGRTRLLVMSALLQIYEHLGYHFVLGHCARCSAPVGEQVGFSPSAGGVLCSRCKAQVIDAMPVHVDTVKCLRLAATQPLAQIMKIVVHEARVTEMERVLEQIYRWVMR